ncbi:MAG: thioredoxin-dependent thiol peroxidase [Rhodospirillales bacterium]|jgi:peroxiredoxin Q/BCP|nr:thioredoxin-dependent thiol peroxidase [Rhodospirillales bacterium]
MTVETGLPAPDFLLSDDQGNMLSLKHFQGQPVILYFYPKDDTPGCTKEACAFQDTMPDFSPSGAKVIGVSRDSAERHKKFKAKYGLDFPLIVDSEATLCQAYGVWKEKTLYGKTSLGIERSTFLIDAKGVVRRIWRKVKVDGHAAEVLAALGKL